MSNSQFIENIGYVRPDETEVLPETFGVYLMKNETGTVIYVGKAINLKKRVSSYFRKHHEDIKTRLLVEAIRIIDYITVSNEKEALILEANLIKHYQPRYNVIFKDNKFYPFIRVTCEKFPRIMFSRQKFNDNSLYFGPYISANTVRRYIDLIQRLFQIRTCRELPKKECLNYHIKRCSAPCIQKVNTENYQKQVSEAIEMLSENSSKLIHSLTLEMKEAATRLEFETAQSIKEKIEALSLFEQSQHVFLPNQINADFVGMASKMGKILIVVSRIRNGKMIGKQSYTATPLLNEEPEEVLFHFLLTREIDKEVSAVVLDSDFQVLSVSVNDFLKEHPNSNQSKKGFIRISENPTEQSLIRMANENAVLHLSQVLSKIDTSESLKLLRDVLKIDVIPMRIEGFDIANILGTHAVASMVSFYGGKPDKKSYRHFKIRTKDSPDDFAMIHEAVFRRYRRLQTEEESFPDLILVDGGKGQLHAAEQALQELGLELNLTSLAKQNEEIYILGKPTPIVLPKNHPALHVLQRVRDESHRFANRFYNDLKRSEMSHSLLDEIEGIGPKRRAMILDRFFRPDKVNTVTMEEIVASGIPQKPAEKVYNLIKKLYNKKV